MIVIDVELTLQEAAEKRQHVPEVEIVVADEIVYKEISAPPPEEPPVKADLDEIERRWVHEEGHYKGRGELVADLEQEMRDLRIARARLSNRLPYMYREKAGQDEVERHVAKIQAHTDEMKVIYDRMRHVQRYGKLPDPPPEEPDPLQSDNVEKLKELRRSLVDKKCKLKRKLQPNGKEPKNSSRRILWQEELDRVELEYKHVKSKIRELG